MHSINHHSTTIGFLSTWSVYEGTTIDNYTRTLLQGICAAARDRRCNLLLGCGIGLPSTPRGSRTAWATPGSNADFVPVGPWNTAGLIIIPCPPQTRAGDGALSDFVIAGQGEE